MVYYAGVVFDCDGTLVDSEPSHQAAFDAVSLKHNLAQRDLDKHIGLSLNSLWIQLEGHKHPTLTYDAWVDDIKAYYQQNPCESPLRPHVRSTLQTLSLNHVPLACASNAQTAYVHSTLKRAGIDHHFRGIFAREHVSNPKPHPEIYLKACGRLRLFPHECIAVEDSITGIRSAKTAGLTVIAFPHAYTQASDLSLADFIVEDIQDILKFVEITCPLNKAA